MMLQRYYSKVKTNKPTHYLAYVILGILFIVLLLTKLNIHVSINANTPEVNLSENLSRDSRLCWDPDNSDESNTEGLPECGTNVNNTDESSTGYVDDNYTMLKAFPKISSTQDFVTDTVVMSSSTYQPSTYPSKSINKNDVDLTETLRNYHHEDCQRLHYDVTGSLPLTALASFPGCGNSWLRHLIQQATGIYTGHLRTSEVLLKSGMFPAEGVHNRSVIVFKTHKYPPFSQGKLCERVLLLVRSPDQALLSEFNRRWAGRLGHVTRHRFNTSDWDLFSTAFLKEYRVFYQSWLRKFSGPKYIVHYENLVSDLKKSLEDALRFLKEKGVNKNMIKCVIRNSEGPFHRSEDTSFNPFSEMLLKKMNAIRKELYTEIDKCLKSGECQGQIANLHDIQ